LPAGNHAQPVHQPKQRESNGDDLIIRNNQVGRGFLMGAGLLSFILGIALGLWVTWVFWPVEFKNADPADLRPSLKDDLVLLISLAYEQDGNLPTAQQRLAALRLANATQTFDRLIAREKQNSQNTLGQDALIHLGQALGLALPYTTARLAPDAPTPIRVYVVATPVQVLTFRVVEHTPLTCADEPESGKLRIIVKDVNGKDLPNIGIEIKSGESVETIYTGLKPERGIGYADYDANPGTYSAMILNAESEIVSDLVIGDAPADCRNDQGKTPRGWKIIFQQK